MFTKAFWKDLAERVVSTFAGGVLSVFGLDALNILDADWKAAFGFGIGAAVLSLLKCLAARKVGDTESAALNK